MNPKELYDFLIKQEKPLTYAEIRYRTDCTFASLRTLVDAGMVDKIPLGENFVYKTK